MLWPEQAQVVPKKRANDESTRMHKHIAFALVVDGAWQQKMDSSVVKKEVSITGCANAKHTTEQGCRYQGASATISSKQAHAKKEWWNGKTQSRSKHSG